MRIMEHNLSILRRKYLFYIVMNHQYLVLRTFVISFLFLLFSMIVKAQSPVASFTVNVSSGCQPLSVQFANTSQNAVSYLWNFGNGNTSNLANPSNVYNLSGNYTVSLTASDANGVSNTKSITNFISVVPTPTAGFLANAVTACQGYGAIQFTNTSANYDSCIWDFGDGTKSNLFNPIHIFSLAGMFNVSLLVFNSSHYCSDILTKPQFITIHPVPVVTINVDTIVTCDSLHSFNFNATGSFMNSWYWTFGDGTISTSQTTNHAYNHSGFYTVSLIATSNVGCKDTVSLVGGITVKSNPVPVVTLSDSAGCAPLPIQMNNNITNAQWIWSFGDGDSAYTKNVLHIYDSIGIFNLSLQVLQLNGCSQTVYFDSITIVDAPHPSFSVSSQSGCAPLSVQYNNTTIGSYNWLWNFGDGTTSTATNPIHVYDSTGYFVPSLTASSNNGCSNISINNWYYISVVGPTANFNTDVLSGCPPLQVNFTDLSTNAIQWLWIFGDGFSSNQQHPSHTYNSGGSYSVTLIVTNTQGCKDTFVYPSTIFVGAPVNNFIAGLPVTACAPFIANFSDQSGAVTWLWDFGDGTTSSLQAPIHVYTQPGTYIVSLTTQSATGGCSQFISNYSTFIIKGGVANFSHTENTCPPYQSQFIDSSQNAVSWLWDFGDGTTSTLQNPVHTYSSLGNYNVMLTITTADGCTVTKFENNAVHFTTFGAKPTLFTLDTVPPINVQYQANSVGATSWLWNFGDGGTSTLQNPFHVFNSLGPFTLTLTISGSGCNYTYTYPPVTFGGAPPNPGGGGSGSGTILQVYDCAPFIEHFVNPKQNAVSWLWDFGDNSTSVLPNPVHMYVDSGSFQVKLYTTDLAGNLDSTAYHKSYHIRLANGNFIIQPTNTCNGVLINLSAVSPASSYQWSFGDGTNSTLASPSHQYPNLSSNYVVSFSVTDTNGCSTYSTQSFYTGTGNPLSSSVRRACANDSIYFYSGLVNYSSYLWDFGDGTTSSIQNPVHLYQDSGSFTVNLSVTDVNACATNFILPSTIQIYHPIADFTLTAPYSNCVWVSSQMTNLSTGADSYLWDFGDGTTSSLFSPQHYFIGLGYHDITLTANKNICASTKVIPQAVYFPNRAIDFSSTQSGECLPVVANFTDLSVDAVKWRWDFGDGDTSNLQHPVHVYNQTPVGNITLSITDVNGCTISLTKPRLQMSSASFSISATSACNPSVVSFGDSSLNATSWLWYFGDGDSSILQNPTHIYTADGTYNIQLIIQGSSGCSDTLLMDSLLVVSSSSASFTAINATGCVPLVTDFTDQSVNAVSWFWDFGDGSTSANQHPTHIFNQPGIYTVTLVVANALGCSDTLIMNNLVTVRGAVPSFTLSDSLGCNPLQVRFTDHTQGAVSWDWNFGDGSTDSVASPTHIYSLAGNFIATLITHDSSGCVSSLSYPNAIQVNTMPTALFSTSDSVICGSLPVSFNNLSLNADSVVWFFGDGNSSTDFSPIYTYSAMGSFYPFLIAYNASGCSDTFQLSNAIKINYQPVADFTSDIVQGCASLPVSFTDLSAEVFNPIYLWDFGNGYTSSSLNPMEVYTTPGFYDVSLTVTNEGGCSDVKFRNAYVRVYDPAPPPVSIVKSVSVISNSEVAIQWDVCPVIDFGYYTLHRLNALTGVFDSITFFNQSNISINQGYPIYFDDSLNTLNSSYSYRIQTTDLCGNAEDTMLLKTNSTINLNAIAVNKHVELSWSPFEGCNFDSYEIYREDNSSGAYNLIVSLPSSQLDYIDNTTFCPYNYSYKVMATNLCADTLFVSWSDSACAQPQSDIALQQVEIVRSTVVNNSFVLTEWNKPIIAPQMVLGYRILRSTDEINYNEIAVVTAAELSYSDYAVDVQNQKYYYKIVVLNHCNVETTESGKSSSILLQGDYSNLVSKLRWSKYQDWDTGVEKYVIEKKDKNGVWHVIKSVDGNTTEAEDE